MKKNNVLSLTLIAVFTALILIQSYVPQFGYITVIPGLPAITTVVLTVSIAGAVLGPRMGAIIGLIWGVIAFIMAYTQPGSPVSLLLFQNPFIAIVPRILTGLVSGYAVVLLNKFNTNQFISYGVAGLLGALVNTLGVIVIAALVFMNNPEALTQYLGNTQSSQSLFFILLAVLGVNAVTEAGVSLVVTSVVGRALSKAFGAIK
ncbi:ECF transporter S component [Holzapfeliella sp. He02]|uniref:ECF transporter S component n=1 Tax=Holzapfeliella saturejae TaxID=3082953 RepID=A0ABU8SHE0_9LACO